MSLERAREVLASASQVLVTAGAGLGVDSGLPDFRGNRGFWRAFPAAEALGLSFEQLANPRWFDVDPSLAWGFYGARLASYRSTRPHAGFTVLREFVGDTGFVFTSNVDGQFEVAGFDPGRIVEIHGSIHHLQCSVPCGRRVWVNDISVTVDPTTMRATGTLPRCDCGAVARPNVCMFDDHRWIGIRSTLAARRYNRWLDALEPRGLVVLEIGAGTAIPSVRTEGERLLSSGASLIRINPSEAEGPAGTLCIRRTGLEALQSL